MCNNCNRPSCSGCQPFMNYPCPQFPPNPGPVGPPGAVGPPGPVTLPCIDPNPLNQIQGTGAPGNCLLVLPAAMAGVQTVTGCNVDNTNPANPVILPVQVVPVSPTQALTGDGCAIPLAVCIDNQTIVKDINGCLTATSVAPPINIVTTNAGYNVLGSEDVILVDLTFGGIVINLLAANNPLAGRATLTMKDIFGVASPAFDLTIQAQGGNLIDGQASISLFNQAGPFGSVTLVSDKNLNYYII